LPALTWQIRATKKLRFSSELFLKVAGWTRLELAASGVTGRRSNQLNYHPKSDIEVREATRDLAFVKRLLEEILTIFEVCRCGL
jgi:hypothetical protein